MGFQKQSSCGSSTSTIGSTGTGSCTDTDTGHGTAPAARTAPPLAIGGIARALPLRVAQLRPGAAVKRGARPSRAMPVPLRPQVSLALPTPTLVVMVRSKHG